MKYGLQIALLAVLLFITSIMLLMDYNRSLRQRDKLNGFYHINDTLDESRLIDTAEYFKTHERITIK